MANYLVENSTALKLALCPGAVCINQGLLKRSLSFDTFPHALCSISGVFALLQAYAFLQYLKDRLTRQEFQTLFFLGVSLAAGMVFLTVIYLTYTGMLGFLLTTGKGYLLLWYFNNLFVLPRVLFLHCVAIFFLKSSVTVPHFLTNIT